MVVFDGKHCTRAGIECSCGHRIRGKMPPDSNSAVRHITDVVVSNRDVGGTAHKDTIGLLQECLSAA